MSNPTAWVLLGSQLISLQNANREFQRNSAVSSSSGGKFWPECSAPYRSLASDFSQLRAGLSAVCGASFMPGTWRPYRDHASCVVVRTVPPEHLLDTPAHAA